MFNVKTTLKAVLVGSIIASTALYGDSKEFDTLTKYMSEKNMDMNKVMDRKTWINDAVDVVENVSDYYIVDLRQGDIAPKNGIKDFEDGHIAGAHNTTFENIVEFVKKNNPGKDNVLVVDEDGQSAAAAAVALRLSGYANTKVLKFGMAGWNKKFDVWSDKRKSPAVGHKNWTMDKAPAPVKYDVKPDLQTGKSTGEEILKVQVDRFLKKGFQTVYAEDILNNPEKYHVVNQGTDKDYGQFGRLAGSNQFVEPMIKPKGKFGSLDFYPANKEIVQYCWTGHAGITTASWMSILGYNAKGLSFGTNALFFDTMTKTKFGKPAGYSFVSGE